MVVLLSGEAHDLADDGDGPELPGEVDAEPYLGPEIELAGALQERATHPDVGDHSLVLAGVHDEAGPVSQPDRDAAAAPRGNAQELLEPAVPEERVDGHGDHRVRPRHRELGLDLPGLAAVEAHDRRGPGRRVGSDGPHEGSGFGPREVDHDHLRAGRGGCLDRPLGPLEVDAVDVRPAEDGRAEDAGEALRTDHEDLQHAAQSNRNRPRAQGGPPGPVTGNTVPRTVGAGPGTG
jgi:hypothetical protein